MKDTAKERKIQNSKPKKDIMNQLPETTFECHFATKVENVGMHSNDLSVLPPEKEGPPDSHAGLIKAFNNLDLNDIQCLLNLDWKSKSVEDKHNLLPLNCTAKSSKDSVSNAGGKDIGEGNAKPKNNVTAHEKNVLELGETPSTTHSNNKDQSAESNEESSEKVKSEDDLSSFFSEMCLNKKPLCNVSGSDIRTNKDKDSQGQQNLLDEKAEEPVVPRASSIPFNEEIVHKSSQDKHTCENLLNEEVCEPTITEVNGVLLKNIVDSFSKTDTSCSINKKSETLSENEICYSDNDELDDEDLVERGSTKKGSNSERKQKKIIAGRTQKVQDNAAKYQKDFAKLHMSGGLFVDTSSNKTLNTANGYFNLVPFDDSSGQRNFMGSNVQTSSLPVFFDPNPINPVIEGSHIDNSFSSPCESDSFLDDIFTLPSVQSSSSNNPCTSFMEVQNQSTLILDAQNQRNIGSRQATSTYDSFEDISNHPSPLSEMSSLPAQSSRSTTPESGYGSSPRLSPYSDDGFEQCKDKQPLNSHTSLLEICSPPPCVPNVNEFTDGVNWDFSIFDFETTSPCEIQHTEEESKEINVIKQELKKCEELCKRSGSNMLQSGCDTLSKSSVMSNTRSVCTVNSSSFQGNSALTCIPHQPQSTNVNITTQMPSVSASTPQMLVIYVPYAVNGADKVPAKPFKPIEPDPEGQRLLARSPRESLNEKLDRKKKNHYHYKIAERLSSGDKNVIYIENTETLQTNLHCAVIKQDLEHAYCIMELHKKHGGDLSMVNCRDIYKKTALQYAVKNVMTVFVKYLKHCGAK